MNKEQAKATIEAESLLRQEAKLSITKKTEPVSDNRYVRDTLDTKTKPLINEEIIDKPDDMLESSVYIESKYQAHRYNGVVKGPKQEMSEGPFTDAKTSKYETKNSNDKLSKTKFTNKKPSETPGEGDKRSQKSSKFEAVNKAKETKNDKLFKAEDAISEVVAVKKRTQSKFTDKELRQKEYFVGKLENDNRPVTTQEVNTDDAIVYKTFNRNRVRKVSDKPRLSHLNKTMSATKYHVDRIYDQDEHNTDETAKEVSMIANRFTSTVVTGTKRSFIEAREKRRVKKIMTAKSVRFIPGKDIKELKNGIVNKMDLQNEQKRLLKRFLGLRHKEEMIFGDMKLNLANKIVSKIKRIAKRNTTGVIIAAVCLAFVISAIGSAGILFEGISEATGVYLSGLSLSTDFDMTDCENYFTKMEADLQDMIDNVEEYYPGFDRYELSIEDEIGHDALKLMAYLSAVYEGYDLSMIQDVLNDLFEDMYVVETEEKTEIEDEEEIKIFSLTMKKTDWDTLMATRISDDKSDLYDSYDRNGGGHQAFHNPFDSNWSDKITSPFGWRIHPISGEEKFHRGVDIGMRSGTPVRSCSEGVVVKSTYSDVEGNYVVVLDETGYKCHYMHLSERNVSEGDIVDYSTIIGKVGSTGYSTGPHLHLQITDQSGECLNPVFLVQGGY